MLSALMVMEDGKKKLVVASRDLPREAEYICKFCGARVYLRKGKIKIPHFAHFPNQSGSCDIWEPETKDHLLGKKFMRSTLWQFSKYSEYERNMKKYYPDVYVRTKDNYEIAVEVQCSKKPIEEVIRKTLWYSRHGIYTLWVFSWQRFVGGNIKISKEEERARMMGVYYSQEHKKSGVVTAMVSKLEHLVSRWYSGVYYFQFYGGGKIRLLKAKFAPRIVETVWQRPFDDDIVRVYRYRTRRLLNVFYRELTRDDIQLILKEIKWEGKMLKIAELSPIRIQTRTTYSTREYYANHELLEKWGEDGW